MTPLQIVAAIAAVAVPSIIPTTAVVISILRSDSKIDALSTRIDALSTRVDSKIDTLSARTDAKIDALRSDLRGDMSILENIGYTHHGRLTRLETRTGTES